MRRLPDDPQARKEIFRRAQAMAGLVNHPGFQELLKEADRKEERIRKTAMARVMNGEIDPRSIDYDRGLMQGMKNLLRVPHDALALLEEVRQQEDESREEERV